MSHDAHLSPPFVQIEGALNCRHVPLPSSIEGSQDGSPKTLWLLRAGDISRITPRGIEQLKALHIRTIFDLRSSSDIAKFQSPPPVIEGVNIVSAPLLPEPSETTGGSGEWYADDHMRKVYAEFRQDEQGSFMDLYSRVLETGKEGIEKVLRSLISRDQDDRVLFHCNGGKDRTGVLAAIILSLAGVEDSIIVHDYALTSTGLAPFSAALLKRFESDAAFQEETEGATNMFSSRPATMQNFLEMLRTKYGGGEAYARDFLSLSETEIETLKKRLVYSVARQ